jgi:hypothetical protein
MPTGLDRANHQLLSLHREASTIQWGNEVQLKAALARMPRLRSVLRKAKRAVRGSNFSTSADYWEERYRVGGNSGAGSYSRLAAFKAEVLNEFVAAKAIKSVIEFGSGDGAQLELAKYPSYIGVDVSRTVVEATRRRFANDPSVRFLHTTEVTEGDRAELALSLDVIYHLVENEVFDTYMRQLFGTAIKYVIVYASNEDKAWLDPHVRHRQFTRWIDANRPDFELVETIRNPYPFSEKDQEETSFADFYIFARHSQR